MIAGRRSQNVPNNPSILVLNLFGPFRAALGEADLPAFRTDKVRALLAYLAVEADMPHRRESLAGLLWPEMPDAAALSNLRKTLHRLREPLGALAGPLLAADRPTVQLHSAAVHSDVGEFRQLLAESASHPHTTLYDCDECLARLARAAELYAGEFLAGLSLPDAPAFEEWLVVQRESLRLQTLTALGELADAYAQRGEHGAAVDYATRQLALEPWHEAAHRQLMRALAARGQRAEALAQLDACRRVLAEALGVEPSAETLALAEQIRAGPPSAARLHGFPAPPTHFIGREAEVEAITRQVCDEPECRLLTLVGPGGIGKTRLAQQAAAAALRAFPHGLYFVPLAVIGQPANIVAAIAHALNFHFRGQAEPRAQLIQHLRDRELLLVMDNFEHLLAGAELLAEILEAAPGVRCLATSREPLRLRWEWLFEVPGLATPDERATDIEGYSAVQLFVQAARQRQPRFRLDSANRAHVARVCRLVQGMPLGLELAAAWVRSLTPAEVVAGIERNLDFLAAPMRDMPERHHSLRAVFTQSWDLLSEDEQLIFARLAVFRGGFARAAAERIAGASLPALAALVDKSLIRLTPTGRYESHEVLRQFALEQLHRSAPEAEQTTERHAAYFAEFMQQREPQLKSSRQKEALAELGAEIGNIRAAWHYAVERGGAERVAAALECLHLFCEMRGWFQEGAELFGYGVAAWEAAGRGDEPVAARMRARRGRFLHRLGLHEAGRGLLQLSLRQFRAASIGDETALALLSLGSIAQVMGDADDAQACLQESLAISRARGDEWGIVRALISLGDKAIDRREYAEARGYLEESLQRCRAIGDRRGLAHSLDELGLAALAQGEYREAQRLFEESLAALREIEDEWGVAVALNDLGLVAYRLGGDELPGAARYLDDSLNIFNAIGDRWGMATAHYNLGRVHAALGDSARARHHLQHSLRFNEESGDGVGCARVLVHLGSLAFTEGDRAEAGRLLRQSLKLNRDRSAPVALQALAGMAQWLAESEPARAASLATYIQNQPEATPDTQRQVQQLLSQLGPQLMASSQIAARPLAEVVDEFANAPLTPQLPA
jgi:predicted ATPase/DNA-binding SARP family transcriptional activator